MKKNFVSLSVKVVDVQLSDCIAGSNSVGVSEGQILNQEMNGFSGRKGAFDLDQW